MTNKEAIEIIDKLCNIVGEITWDELTNILEKRKPKKPVIKRYAGWSGCGCGMKIYPMWKVCPYCGQYINWD